MHSLGPPIARRGRAISQSNRICTGADCRLIGAGNTPHRHSRESGNPAGDCDSLAVGKDDAFGIKWVPAFAGTTGVLKLGSFLRFF